MAERKNPKEIIAQVEIKRLVKTELQDPGPEKENHQDTLHEYEEEDRFQKLLEIGEKKGFVTQKDIVRVYPEIEYEEDSNEDLEDMIYSGLTRAGIHHLDEVKDVELQPIDKKFSSGKKESANDDYLADIDANDSVGLFMKEVGQVPLLNAEQEVYLSKRIERGQKASELFAQQSVSSEKQAELHRLIEDGWAAREHLIRANRRLVISVAKKYQGRGVPFLDLTSEGTIGLIRAGKKFDYHRGLKFSTYATWWIRQAVTRAVNDQGRTVRIPVHMGEQINRMLRATHDLTQILGRTPTTEELAGDLGEEVKKVENMIQVAQRPISLETPIDDEDDSALKDFIEDEDSPAPVEVATKNSLREEIRNALHTLPPREARILRFRYGIPNGETYTLKEIGRKMEITRERVRQIEAQALRHLRNPSQKRKLENYLRE